MTRIDAGVQVPSRTSWSEVWRSPLAVLSLITPSGAAMVGAIFGIAHFWTNDDVGNLMWVSGGFTGTPESLSPVMGPIFTGIVASLYRATNNVPWYPLAILTVPAIGGTLLLRDLHRRVTTAGYVAIVGLSSFGMLLLGVQINYTFSSFVSSSFAVLLLLTRVTQNDLRLRSLGAPLVLCALSLSIRTTWSTSDLAMSPAYLYVGVLAVAASCFLGDARIFHRLLKVGAILGIPYLVMWLPQLAILLSDSSWANFIDFYSVRGSLNGSLSYGQYLDSMTRTDVLVRTGVDQAALWELENWSLFDSHSATIDNLRALAREVTEFRQRQVLSDAPTFAVDLGRLLFGKLVWFVLASMVLLFLPNGQLQQTYRLRRLGFILVVLVLSSSLILMATAGVRLPSYVFSGAVFATALVLVVTATLNVGAAVLDVKFRLIMVNALALTLMGTGCWVSFGGDVFRVSVNGLPSASEYREIFRKSSSLDKPVIHDPHLVGKAYQYTPFDVSMPTEYLNSMSFGGGSNVRSPQYVRRWNMITGESQSPETLFGPQFYEHVYFQSIAYAELFSYRQPCTTLNRTDAGLFEKGKLCEALVALEAGNRNEDHWFSTPEGFLFMTVREMDQLSLKLISPFGSYAKPHLTEVSVVDVDGRQKSSMLLTVRPDFGSTIHLYNLNRGDLLLVKSVDSCVAPIDVNPEYLDRTQLCVGLVGVSESGNPISLQRL